MSEQHDARGGEDRNETNHSSRSSTPFRDHLHRKRRRYSYCLAVARAQRRRRVVHENLRTLASRPQLRAGPTGELPCRSLTNPADICERNRAGGSPVIFSYRPWLAGFPSCSVLTQIASMRQELDCKTPSNYSYAVSPCTLSCSTSTARLPRP
jgi:hypothetical protein